MTEEAIRTIGKYEILGVLGRGSMGVVYRARDPEIGRLVAVKTLRKTFPGAALTMDMALERFKIEARSAGQLRHPNIVTIFEVGKDGDTPYIVMDYVEGRGLDAILQEQHSLSWSQAMKYLEQIASALDFAHSRGVIHRDIKPSNFLIDVNDRAYILDFGVAGFTDSLKQERASVVMGSPGYMSPEQILNEHLDHRSDLFSFAILAFECLAGERPFSGQAMTEVVSNILNSPPKSAHLLNSELPKSLDLQFTRALSRERIERFDKASSFCSALRHAYEIGNSNIPKSVNNKPGSDWSKSHSGAYSSTQSQTTIERDDTPPDHDSRRIRSRLQRLGVEPKQNGSVFADAAHKELKNSNNTSGIRTLTLACAIFAGLLSITLIWIILNGIMGRLTESSQPTNSTKSTPSISDTAEFADASTDFTRLGGLNDSQISELIKNQANDAQTYVHLISIASKRKLSALNDVTDKLLEHNSAMVRSAMLKSLQNTTNKSLIPLIIKKLDDRDPQIRTQAVTTLLSLKDTDLIQQLSAKLLVEKDPDVRQALTDGIVILRSQQDIRR